MSDAPEDLRVYKDLPEWTAQTLPKGFQRQHNTKPGTWARLTVSAGALRFTHLTEDGRELSSREIRASSGPQLVEPGAWHRVEAVDDALRCQLSFLCTPQRYLEKKYKLTAPHSEVRAALPSLQDSPGRRVLDLGSGRGRNSFFLAEHGFDVTAVDRDQEALDTLGKIRAAEGFDVEAKRYDIEQAMLGDIVPGGEVDHIVSTVVFQFLDATRVTAIIADMQAVTRPGGLHLIVAPVTSAEVPCPLSFPFTFDAGALGRHYAHWETLRYEEAIGEFHKRDGEGNRYRGLFGTLLARRPAD